MNRLLLFFFQLDKFPVKYYNAYQYIDKQAILLWNLKKMKDIAVFFIWNRKGLIAYWIKYL